MIKLEVKYKAGHSYNETWVRTEYFCPGCGKQEVHMRDGGGDYYVGEQYICTACDHTFHMPSGMHQCHNWQDLQRLEALRG